MDDDDYRQGKPTSHKVFGEDIAILAGDALLTEAFHLLSGTELAGSISPEKMIAVIREISRAAGFFGMVGGQVVDITSEGKAVDLTTLHYIHTRKTGALITAAVRAGALLAGAGEEKIQALGDYGERIGLAFQIADDILDVEGDRELLGKATGADHSRKKATYPGLVGLEASRSKAGDLVERAVEALVAFDGKADPLRWIARFIVERKT
jgi:geranylgeranyl diphosphate synthase type II